VLAFLGAGIVNGWVMSLHAASKHLFYSTGSHFIHIFISSMASIFYLVSFGFAQWWKSFAFVFIFLIIAVVVPCTLSDLVVPVLWARRNKGHKGGKNNPGTEQSGCCGMGSGNEKH
jgi:hypothetical protein